MPKQGLTEEVVVLDRSGSMGAMRDEAMNGFNDFLKKQQALPGEANLTLILFDHEYLVEVDGKPIKDVQPLTDKTYVPRGTTALLDAVGRAITTVGERLGKLDEAQRPERVIVMILTDGFENASHEYTKAKIQEMIKHQTDVYNWAFTFLAANCDAFAGGKEMGIAQSSIANYAHTSAGYKQAFASVNDMTAQYRCSGKTGDMSDWMKKHEPKTH